MKKLSDGLPDNSNDEIDAELEIEDLKSLLTNIAVAFDWWIKSSYFFESIYDKCSGQLFFKSQTPLMRSSGFPSILQFIVFAI